MARLNLVAANPQKEKAPRNRATARPLPVVVPPSNDDQKDHFITKNGLSYAGSHLIIDLWEAEGLADRERIERALIDAVTPSAEWHGCRSKSVPTGMKRFGSGSTWYLRSSPSVSVLAI